MVKISIIIPCFNGFGFMEKCLQALERQTVSPYEIIVVDDCSTDDSFERMKVYIQNSSLNFKHIRNEKNMGPGITRKKAVDIATGDYIAFCDCDDWYEDTFVESAITEIKRKNADVLIFDNFVTYDDRKFAQHIATNLVGKEKSYIVAHYPMSMCRLVVKRDLFDGLYFPPIYNGEDGAVVPQVFWRANKICVLDMPLYNYYFREGSVSNKPSKKAYAYLLEAFSAVEKIKADMPEECEFLGIKMVCYGASLNALKTNINYSIISKFVTDFGSKYPNWEKNKYLSEYSKVKKLFLFFIRYKMLFIAGIFAKLHFLITKNR